MLAQRFALLAVYKPVSVPKEKIEPVVFEKKSKPPHASPLKSKRLSESPILVDVRQTSKIPSVNLPESSFFETGIVEKELDVKHFSYFSQ